MRRILKRVQQLKYRLQKNGQLTKWRYRVQKYISDVLNVNCCHRVSNPAAVIQNQHVSKDVLPSAACSRRTARDLGVNGNKYLFSWWPPGLLSPLTFVWFQLPSFHESSLPQLRTKKAPTDQTQVSSGTPTVKEGVLYLCLRIKNSDYQINSCSRPISTSACDFTGSHVERLVILVAIATYEARRQKPVAK